MALPDTLPYVPRSILLEQVLRLLLSGAHVTLFAPRGQGKTMFVRNELLPKAHEGGWFAARIDLWRNRANPALGLVEGLEAIANANLGTATNWLTGPLTLKKLKTKIKVPGVEVEGEWEPVVAGTAPAHLSLENRLANALHGITQHADHALLVLDEFQALAEAPGSDNFIAAFRTSVQDLQDRLSLFYTGSSRDGLNKMFRRSKAPLFQSAHPVALPQLGDDFVDTRADYLHDMAGLDVDRDLLKTLFGRLEHTPLFLNEIVRIMLIGGSNDIHQALKTWLKGKREEQYNDVLAGLQPLDIAVIVWLSTMGENSIYTRQARSWMKEFLDEHAQPTPQSLQGSLRRLTKADLVEPTGATGAYELADRGLLIFLRELAGTGPSELLLSSLFATESQHADPVEPIPESSPVSNKPAPEPGKNARKSGK